MTVQGQAGRSGKSHRRGRLAVLAVTALALPLSACGGGAKDSAAGPDTNVAPVINVEASVTPTPEASAPATSSTGVSKGANVRAAHIQHFAWADPKLKDPIIEMIKAKKIDTVQLDIKDEDGIVGYSSQVPLAVQAGVTRPYYDAKAAVDEIHALGAKVVGRIVAFRDPRMGKWALGQGKMDLLIQNTSGGAYSAGNYGQGSFTNFANTEIIEYNAALGEEAAKFGFDGIMYDYIRKPENKGQVYKGIGDRTPEQAIADFVAVASPRIRAAGASVGAAVYGVASFTPWAVAQDIPAMAKNLDFISPMVYPSHWARGEYSVAHPNGQPYDILKRSLMDFNRMVLTTNPDCQIVPWIQAFSYTAPDYTPYHVKEQIRAAKDVGINSWYLWHSGSKYSVIAAPGLEPREASGNGPGTTVYSINRPGNNSEGTTDRAKALQYIEAFLAWDKGGRVGTFQDPLNPSATATTPATPAATPTPSGSPAAATTPASTPASTPAM
ncbi:MAG: putative glycoside hydrolase [Sporichthyaceae bacterium]